MEKKIQTKNIGFPLNTSNWKESNNKQVYNPLGQISNQKSPSVNNIFQKQ